MSAVNPNWNKTITLFNCLKGADNPSGTGDVWYKTVIPDCYFKCVTKQVNSGFNTQMAGAYTVRIPGSITYLPYLSWVALSAATRSQYFTIRNDDIVILGSSAEVVSNVSPNTAAHVLARNKPNAFKVTAASDNTSIFPPQYRLGG